MVVSVTSVLSFLPLLFLMLIFSLLGELFHYRFKGWDFRLKYLYSLQSWDLCCSLLRFFLPDCLCPFIWGGGHYFPLCFIYDTILDLLSVSFYLLWIYRLSLCSMYDAFNMATLYMIISYSLLLWWKQFPHFICILGYVPYMKVLVGIYIW